MAVYNTIMDIWIEHNLYRHDNGSHNKLSTNLCDSLKEELRNSTYSKYISVHFYYPAGRPLWCRTFSKFKAENKKTKYYHAPRYYYKKIIK